MQSKLPKDWVSHGLRFRKENTASALFFFVCRNIQRSLCMSVWGVQCAAVPKHCVALLQRGCASTAKPLASFFEGLGTRHPSVSVSGIQKKRTDQKLNVSTLAKNECSPPTGSVHLCDSQVVQESAVYARVHQQRIDQTYRSCTGSNHFMTDAGI